VARNTRGCGCVVAIVALVLAVAAGAAYKFALPWWKQKPPPPSGKDMKVVVFDVGQGDSILIVSPSGSTMLIDAGDETKGKLVVEGLKREGIDHLDYFVATHAHPDHIGGAPIVLEAFKVGTVLQNGFPPPEMSADEAEQSGTTMLLKKALNKGAKPQPAKTAPKLASSKKPGKTYQYPTVTAYNNFKTAVGLNGAKLEQPWPGQTIDLGGGAIVTVLAPIEPYFTREQVREGGNEPNANSIVMRLIYGDFSMLLPGDAETQTEQRLLGKDINLDSLSAKILKVAHHGSKYATSEDFIKRVKPEVAIISDGEYNRYGHPSQVVLDRLKANGVSKVYRTDLQGDVTITSNGKTYDIKAAKDAKSDLWVGRQGTKDDASRSGFITYGDFGPPPKPPKQKK
jgi:competence protein ComEC